MARGCGVFALCLLACVSACRKSHDRPERQAPLVVADQPRLREDPAAAQKSSAQWDRHLKAEEDERQTFFDRPRVPQHRAAIALLTAARKRYDRARTQAELAGARQQVAQAVDELRRRVHELDRWGTNSRLLPDYAALETSLLAVYPDAKGAELKGDDTALVRAQADFDAHLKTMERWLEKVEDEDEAAEEG